MTGHTRELTYPAVIRLLEDGKWHTAADLETVTCFPVEWLSEVEREHPLERRPGAPELVRIHHRSRSRGAARIRIALLLAALPLAIVVGWLTGSTDALLAVLAVGLLASIALSLVAPR